MLAIHPNLTWMGLAAIPPKVYVSLPIKETLAFNCLKVGITHRILLMFINSKIPMPKLGPTAILQTVKNVKLPKIQFAVPNKTNLNV